MKAEQFELQQMKRVTFTYHITIILYLICNSINSDVFHYLLFFGIYSYFQSHYFKIKFPLSLTIIL